MKAITAPRLPRPFRRVRNLSIYKLEMAMVHYNVYLLKFNSQNKYIHLKLIILDCMVNFYRSKGLTATALNFSILRHTFTRSYFFFFNNVYL